MSPNCLHCALACVRRAKQRHQKRVPKKQIWVHLLPPTVACVPTHPERRVEGRRSNAFTSTFRSPLLFSSCPLPDAFSATSPVPAVHFPIRIPQKPRKPVAAAVLTLQNDFLCYPIITVGSHFPCRPKKWGKKKKKMHFTTEVPMGCWALALVGLNSSSWQPLADFADTGKHAGSNESGFSVRAMLPMCLGGICC